MKGKIQWYNIVKGFGFIRPEDGSNDIFVHHTGIKQEKRPKELFESQEVEFELSKNEKGRIAIGVVALSIPPAQKSESSK